jgi:transposase InsO family protein
MDNDISNAAANCSSCTSSSRLPSQPAEPLKQHEPATRPFEQIFGDLGEEDGRMFLALVDAFSGWPHVAMFPDKHVTSRRVIDALREFFATFGAPVKFWSDNGPQFTAAEIQSSCASTT